MYRGVFNAEAGHFPVDCVDENATPSSASAASPSPSAVAASATPVAASSGPGPIERMVDKLFTMLKPDANGCLSGGQLQPVMMKSEPALPKAALGAIWSLADSKKAGKLGKTEVLLCDSLLDSTDNARAFQYLKLVFCLIAVCKDSTLDPLANN